ncbi:MAG: Plug domain-containing protein, partial [Halieaceae bacterium]|nr:Plug domain-containing protein [Halieaceae bacterium]
MDIPESVSAISAIEVERRNIKGLNKIGLAVPNLNLSMRTDGYPNVTIRGLGAYGMTQGVGFYLDDVQLFSDASSRFGDIERIEVLKGPQGVLYGGSNIGGAVKYVSKAPSTEATS